MLVEYRGGWVIIVTATALTDRNRVYSFNTVITTVCVPIPYCIHILRSLAAISRRGFAVQWSALLHMC